MIKLLEFINKKLKSSIRFFTLELNDEIKISVYKKSVNILDGKIYLIGKSNYEKNLYVFSTEDDAILKSFSGKILETKHEDSILKVCSLSYENTKSIQKIFDYTIPSTIGNKDSFGFGDRLGLANPGHLLSAEKYNFFPILCQQSIRELTRTKRTPYDVMNAAVWAVFQEGHHTGFGADADHLKTKYDIDLMVEAGYTMITIDPSDYVVDTVDEMTSEELEKQTNEFGWDDFNTTYDELKKLYVSKEIKINDSFSISASEEDLQKAVVKYGKAVIHIYYMAKHLENQYSEKKFDIEISVDETESTTTPFEHYFISNELKRFEVIFHSLAPRFIGGFEKGIDYKGDLEIFEKEYTKHLFISELFGDYKISLHSGSDKFLVYKTIGKIKHGNVHVKTAGTSYLEALRVVASVEPNMFREILDFAKSKYETEKKTYHVSADIKKVKKASDYPDIALPDLLSDDNVRQILHVTFGLILTLEEGEDYKYKNRILTILNEYEDLHYDYLIKHFNNHMEPFNQ